jgi:PAS domain S-box-containing protein
VAIAAFFTFQVLNFRSSFQRDTATLAAIIANNSTAALAFKDPKAGAEVIGSLQAKPAVVAASLVLPDGTLFAQFGKPDNAAGRAQFPPAAGFRFTGRYLLCNQPVELDNKQVGTLYLRADYRQTFLALLGFYALVILGVMVASIALAVRLSGRLQRIITEPVLKLAETARIVGEKKDYSLRVAASSRGDELGRLTDAFNEMLAKVEGRTAALQQANQALEQEIAERKRMEAELAYERDLLKTLLDNIPDAIYFKDLESRFVRGSKALARVCQQDEAETMKGKTDADFFTEEHARAALNDEQEIIRTGQPILGKVEKETHQNGRVTWALTSKTPWRDQDGNVIGTFGISKDITSIKHAEQEVERLHRDLLTASRQAGMAEVATDVLHNVGNILNSVNVSTTLIREKLQRSEVASLVKLGGLLQQHEDDLPAFLTADPRGKLVPRFIIQLADQLGAEHLLLQQEQDQLTRNIEHIKEIVVMQQNYARVSGFLERVSIANLVDDALQINVAGLSRHGVQVVRHYADVPEVTADKHKVLQILVNLVHNAKYALDESGRPDKRLTVAIGMNGNHRLKITVSDNGVGIPRENLTRIFAHGFSTRKGGHGFGLHSGANAAKEMGGQLSVHSEGPGQGATFTLELPLAGRTTEKKIETSMKRRNET